MGKFQFWRKRVADTVISSVIVAAISPAFAANELVIKTLTDQAIFWQAKGRIDLAADAWKKLLLLDPNHVEALSSLAQFELDNNRINSSRTYTERLKQIQGGSVAAKRIESATSTKRVDPKQLEAARTASKNGDFDEAVRIYRKLLNSKTPSGSLALEYYQNLGGIDEEGWEEARQGLARLNADDSNNWQIALAYAQHLTYRENTRREGIRMLSQLSRQPGLEKQATESWRQSLTWLAATKSDAPLLQAYLTTQGTDAAIRSRLDALTHVERVDRGTNRSSERTTRSEPVKIDPKILTLRDGFTALSSGDLESAAERFEKLLAENPNHIDALGGLGVIRLKQERLAEAEKLLSQATRGSSNSNWSSALKSARFWLIMSTAASLRQNGDIKQAAEQFAHAQQIDPSQNLPVLGMAGILAEQGEWVEAEKSYRHVLQKDTSSLDALNGLISVLSQQGRIDEAAELTERLSPEQREKLGGYGTLKGEQLRRAGTAASQRGDNIAAVKLLEDALLWDPTSPWLRMELGRLYQAAGATNQARAVVDGLLMSDPNQPNALYASALMSGASTDWLAGLEQLERIPTNSRTKEMLTLQKRFWVRAQAERASVLSRSGQKSTALQILRQLEPVAGRDGELLGAVAQGYSDAGEDSRALSTLRTMIAQNTRPDYGLMVQYAAILLKTHQDVELSAQLRQLYTRPLTEQQRSNLDNIRVAYSLRQVDTQREANNIAGAYDILLPLITERPDDISMQLALARLYSTAREYTDALAWYDYALQREPSNLDILVAAAGTALAIPNLSYAESAINNAVQIAPENPSVLTTLGRLYRAQGKTKLATQTFERALVADQTTAKQLIGGPLGLKLINYTKLIIESSQSDNLQSKPRTPPVPLIPSIAPPFLNGQNPNYQNQNFVNRPFSKITTPNIKTSNLKITSVQYIYPSINVQNDSKAQSIRDTLPQRKLQLVTIDNNQQEAPSLQLIPPVRQEPREISSPYMQMQPFSKASSISRENSEPARLSPLIQAQTEATTKTNQALRQEIDDLTAQRSGSATVGAAWRNRNGQSGTSALSEYSVPAEVRLSVGEGGHLVLRATPVFLDSGQINTTDLNTAQQFGVNAFTASQTFSSTNSLQKASGVGLGLGYENLHLKLDIGTTPIGFRATTLIGGINYSDRIGDMSLNLDLSRRSVTDSILSYAGALDDRTGTTWGGVTATGGRGQLGFEAGAIGVYAYGSYHYVGGQNVADNNRYEGGAGTYYKLVTEPNMALTAGLAVTALSYDKNLRYFTYGHGGYFSPQRFASLNFPIEWSGRNGQLSYKLDGSVGLQSLRENSASYFPNNTALQSSWETTAAAANATAGGPAGVTWKTSYAGQSKVGLGFRVGASAEYRFAPKWAIGGRLNIDNSSDFLQSAGLVYVRYNFEAASKQVTFPPNILRIVQ
jgi:cellulose synthase operon protein C